jgi:hypothetical protein
LKSKVTTQPTIEPVGLSEVKEALRVTATSEDSLILRYISDARVHAENYTGRKFINQTIVGYVDGFSTQGDVWWNGVRVGSEAHIYGQDGGCITFDWSPVDSITQVDTIDVDNSETVYSSSNYYLDNFDQDQKNKLVLNDTGTNIITTLRSRNAIKVEYVAGYGANASDVPYAIRRGIVMLAAHLYTNRGDCDGDCVSKSGASSYLEQYKIESVSISV